MSETIVEQAIAIIGRIGITGMATETPTVIAIGLPDADVSQAVDRITTDIITGVIGITPMYSDG